MIAGGLSVLSALLLPTFYYDSSIGFSNSFLSVVYAAFLFLLLRRCYGRKHPKREWVLTHVFGFLLAWMIAMGRAIEQTGRFFPVSWAVCVSILLYSHVLACATSFLWEKLSAFEASQQKHRGKSVSRNLSGSRLQTLRARTEYVMTHRWLLALLLFVCWLPCWLALFPGGFSYDVTLEFHQQSEIYYRAFPRLHSVLMIGCLNAFHRLFGSYNAGIAFYAMVQMLLFSALFADMLTVLWRQRIHKGIMGVLCAYCAFFPVIHLTVTHIGRDTLFAGLLTYFCFLLYRISADRERFFSSLRCSVLIGMILSLMLLSRNNTSEVLTLLLLIILNIVVWRKLHHRYLREVKAFAVANISVYLLLSVILYCICLPISKPNPLMSMGTVSQTMVRAYTDEPEKLSEQDKEDFERFFIKEKLSYCPELADLSRNSISKDAFREDYIGFVRLWVKMGVKCPTSYANAMIEQNRYMWYPDSLIDGYVRCGLYDTEKCYFVTGVASPGTRIHLLPALEEYYRRISADISFEKIPLLSMLFSIGFQFWLLLHGFFYVVYRRRRQWYLPMGFMLAYTVICLFLPIVLLRYFMSLFLFFPITIAMTFEPGNRNCDALTI